MLPVMHAQYFVHRLADCVLRGTSEARFSMPNSVGCFPRPVVQNVTVAMHTDEASQYSDRLQSPEEAYNTAAATLHSNRMTGKY